MLEVKELRSQDIPLICDYWLQADSEYLESMGADINKLPSRNDLTKMLQIQLEAPLVEKQNYALIWHIQGEAIGHNNVNQIIYGEEATMHLHIWNPKNRIQGLGSQFLELSIPMFFDKLKLKRIICEPYAFNSAPNKTLAKLGFSFEKSYDTIPGSLNFHQTVNRWILDRDTFSNRWQK